MNVFSPRASLVFAASITLLSASAACTAGQQLGEPSDGGTSFEGGFTFPDGATSTSTPGDPTGPGEVNEPDAAKGSPPAGAKRFFVSSSAHDGKLGGLAGADQQCTLIAEAANLGGKWKALLAGASLADVGPWYLLDGTKVFNNKANVLAGSPLATLKITEQNTGFAFGANVWTGQPIDQPDLSNDNCSNWTVNTPYAPDGPGGTIGDPYGGSDEWQIAQDRFYACSKPAHLYCIEQ